MLSKMSTKSIETSFAILGFNPFHAQVYLSCMRFGKSSASSIAKQVTLPRSSVYGILRDLVQSGLISEIKEETKLIFSAAPPAYVQLLLKTKAMQVQEVDKKLNQLLPTLTQAYQSSLPQTPKTQFFQGEDGLRTTLYDNLTAQEVFVICEGNTKGQVSLTEDPAYLKAYIHETIIRGIHTKELLQHTPATLEYQQTYASEKHQIILVPQNPNQIVKHVDKYLYTNKIAYVSHDNLVGVIIEDETLSALEKSQFEKLWQFYTNKNDTQ